MSGKERIGRRGFLKRSSLLTGGLILGFTVPVAKRLEAQGAPGAGLPSPNAFLSISPDGTVKVILAHSEMGQGIWTTLPMLIAEELDADWSKVTAEHSGVSPAYNHTAFGFQITGGSTSTHSEFDRYRQVGAMARQLLVEAAAAKFGVKPEDCRTEKGEVIAGQKKAGYGELAAAAAKLPTPAKVTLKDPKDWKIIGKATKRLDSPEKVNGTAQFGMDVHFDGLLTAVVARSPGFGGKVKSLDDKAALATPGVKQVVQVPSGVAVLADHYWAAKQGREKLKIEWEEGPTKGLDSKKLRENFRKLAGTSGATAAKAGDASKALQGEDLLEVEYYVPYLAHAPMEPLNCTVKLDKDQCEIWTGTQMQTVDQQVVAGITGLKPSQISIHTPFLGGGFGRRATPNSDFISEAVQVAKASGKAGQGRVVARR